ncbi:MAG: hypothetical protein QOE29_1850, partial [Gaiellaceae bacterium]|nr:hypothetical protein [Gaiellaceae bacterium]
MRALVLPLLIGAAFLLAASAQAANAPKVLVITFDLD